jgi:hypothetical protein
VAAVVVTAAAVVVTAAAVAAAAGKTDSGDRRHRLSTLNMYCARGFQPSRG